MNIDHAQIKELEYNEITDGIFIGTNQCCQTHFDTALKEKEGITADISLEEDRIDAPFGVDFYAWIPVKDHEAPTQDQLAFGVLALQQIVAMGRKVFVHCQNGHGRAPTLVAAYLITRGLNPEDAERFIQEKRPAVHLSDSQKQAVQTYYSSYSL